MNIYLNTFLNESFENVIDKFINLKNYSIQQLQKIQRWNPSKKEAILQRLDSTSLTRHLLENDWTKDLN